MVNTNIAVSVIVVSWNVREALQACLAALSMSQGVRFEVIVVDNASTDGTAEMLQSFPNVTAVLNKDNRGFATAVDQGVDKAAGPTIVLVNPDVTVLPDTLVAVEHILSADSTIGVLGGRISNGDGTTQHSVHRFPGFADQAITLLKLGTPLRKTKLMQSYRASDFSYDQAADVDQVEGAVFAFTRHLYKSIGGFDRKYFLWFEEVDFCRRAKDSGKRVRYDPTIRAVHHGGLSARQISPLKRHLWYQRSMLRYFRKFHAPLHIALVPFAIVGTLAACIGSPLPRRLAQKLMRPSYAGK